MAPVPCAAAVAKAPPAGILQRTQLFDNLAGPSEDTSRHTEADSPSSSELGYEDAMPAFASAEPNTTDEHRNLLASNQLPPPQPALEDPQRTARSASSVGQPAADPQPQNPWADFSEAPNAPTTQHRSGDIRLRANSAPRPQPNMGMWASRRFFL